MFLKHRATAPLFRFFSFFVLVIYKSDPFGIRSGSVRDPKPRRPNCSNSGAPVNTKTRTLRCRSREPDPPRTRERLVNTGGVGRTAGLAPLASGRPAGRAGRTDGRTDGRTNGQTDGRTGRLGRRRPRLRLGRLGRRRPGLRLGRNSRSDGRMDGRTNGRPGPARSGPARLRFHPPNFAQSGPPRSPPRYLPEMST